VAAPQPGPAPPSATATTPAGTSAVEILDKKFRENLKKEARPPRKVVARETISTPTRRSIPKNVSRKSPPKEAEPAAEWNIIPPGEAPIPTPTPTSAPPESGIPEFPWPPPRASATEVIPSKLLKAKTGATSLRDVERRIRQVLGENGYSEASFYAVPDGFALVTRLEQINDDGTPKEGPQRWSLEVPRLSEFSFSAYLRALFLAPPGYFRVIVFIVTPHPIVQSEAKVTPKEAGHWLTAGADRLPESLGTLDFSREAYLCTALVYEFNRRTESDEPAILDPGNIPGRIHLLKAGLWEALTR
jgi:hypothetical protein